MRRYFQENRALGSKDRAFISETAYALIRFQGLLDGLAQAHPPTWEKRLHCFLQGGLTSRVQYGTLSRAQQASFPSHLYERMAARWGAEATDEICRISNQTAPTTLRINALKTTREAFLECHASEYPVQATSSSPWGVYFRKRCNFFLLSAFKEGLFEVQDEASQLIAALITPKPGQSVLDYCAGSGGKALAIAPQMAGRGQLYLHDIRPSILIEAKKRLKRAGVQNAQILQPDEEEKLDRLLKKIDWVLVDAPCSGSGTYRRNPDLKWKFCEEMVQQLKAKQRLVFEKALPYLKPGGRIVYATCSLLQEENEEQVAHFLKTFPLELVATPFQSLPVEEGMDGMFAAVFRTIG
jgi:16S rRNA (cytosine(967)-C(5))-methyltransferase